MRRETRAYHSLPNGHTHCGDCSRPIKHASGERRPEEDGMDSKTISIQCKGADSLPLDAIEDFQGNLKKRSKKDIDSIIKSIDWNKQTLVMGRQDYHWKHEPCLYGWKEGAAHLWASDRKQTTVLNFDRPSRSTEHPTMKPVELFQYCIENNTKGQDVVLDTFLGSGTTIVACEKIGRTCYGMELDPHYCDVIVARYRQWCADNGRDAMVKLNGEVVDAIH